MSIFSSIDRIRRSSGSSSWPVYLFFTVLSLRVGLDVVDVVARRAASDRLFVGRDRALHFVLHDVFVLLLDDRQQLAVVLALSRRT